MSYWYEVIAPKQDGPDDFAWETLATFQSMITAIQFANKHEDSRCLMVLEENGHIDTVDLPLN